MTFWKGLAPQLSCLRNNITFSHVQFNVIIKVWMSLCVLPIIKIIDVTYVILRLFCRICPVWRIKTLFCVTFVISWPCSVFNGISIFFVLCDLRSMTLICFLWNINTRLCVIYVMSRLFCVICVISRLSDMLELRNKMLLRIKNTR